VHKLYDLEYVGEDYFCVIGNPGTGYNTWRSDPFKWNQNRQHQDGSPNVSAPGWGHNWITAVAYDRVRHKLWVGGRSQGDPTTTSHANIMTRWNGHEDKFFDPDDPPWTIPVVASNDNWHVNGNDPSTSGVLNGGHYWVAALAVDPRNGAAWMSWGADAAYSYNGTFGPVGAVYAVGVDDVGPSWSEGVPQAVHTDPAKADNASQVVAVKFAGQYVYALTCDLETGEFNLFRAPVTSPPPTGACCLCGPPATCVEVTEANCPGHWLGAGTTCGEAVCRFQCCHDPFADADGDGDVDVEDFGIMQACVNTGGGPLSEYPVRCGCYDHSGDGNVTLEDIYAFMDCAKGPGVAANPNCD
jgi:hypothetical protein